MPKSTLAQRLNNDGFQRRNGQMYILRNGQLRPMVRNARLPTGAVVTKDGFVVGRTGRRTELREGQGCDLRGNVVGVVEQGGALALAGPAPAPRQAAAPIQQVRGVLEDLLGGHYYEERVGRGHEEDYIRRAEEQAHERRKREEEWRREFEKKRGEHGRKWKDKRKKGKGWDD